MRPLERLLRIMERLRDPRDGCPWDRQQDWASIAPHTIEEAYELADAIARDEPDAVRDELGDVLFQVVFQSRIAEERGLFDFAAVAGGIADKLERRHPHVFGDAQIADAAAQAQAWDEHKRAERAARGQGTGALDGVTARPAGADARRQARLAGGQGRLRLARSRGGARQGARGDGRAAGGARARRSRRARSEELGDLLFALTQVARHLDIDAEAALRAANAKFERRFRQVEAHLAGRGLTPRDVDMAELEALWSRAKRELG